MNPYATHFKSYSFQNCVSLVKLVIDSSVTEIDHFDLPAESIEEHIIPGSVRVIKNQAFNGMTSLKNISLSPEVESVERSAFAGCTSLTNLTIPKSIDISDLEINDDVIINQV